LESDGTTESEMTDLTPLSLFHLLSRRRISVFGHVARLDDITPANVALQLDINVSLSRPPDRTWRRPPGRPRNNWLNQLRNDSIRPTGDWRALEACCRPWTWWCNDATALAGYANLIMMVMMNSVQQLHSQTADCALLIQVFC